MQKLIFVNRFFFPDHSATSQMLSDLAFFLASEKKLVTVIASRQLYDNAHAELPSSETIEGVKVIRIRTTRFGRSNLIGRAIDYASFYLSVFFSLLKIAEAGDVIIAKTDPPIVSVVCAVVAKTRRARLVNWLQDLFPEVAVALGVRLGVLPDVVLRRVRNWSLRQAVANVAIGNTMAVRLTLQGIPNEKIFTVPNWSSGTAVKPIPKSENQLRKEWGLESNFVVGYSGNMGRVHEFDTMLRAAIQLKDCEHIKFLFIGDGPQRQAVQREAETADLSNIIWKPYQNRDSLSQSLSVADLHIVALRPEMEGLVVPSKYYGIAAAGRATLFIGDTRGEIAKLLTEGQCGMAFQIGDVEGVASFIREAAMDPVGVTIMGENARKLFDAEFDESRALGKWSSLLESVAIGSILDK